MGRDLLGVAKKLKTPGIVLDPVDGSVEVGNFAVGGEDVVPEEVADATLNKKSQWAVQSAYTERL
jgi:hypothetical protein